MNILDIPVKRKPWTAVEFWHSGKTPRIQDLRLNAVDLLEAVEGLCPSCKQFASIHPDGEWATCSYCCTFYKVGHADWASGTELPNGYLQITVRVICGGALKDTGPNCIIHDFHITTTMDRNHRTLATTVDV